MYTSCHTYSIYIYIHYTYIYIYIHTYIHTYIHIYIYINYHTLHMYIYLYIYTHYIIHITYIYINVYIYALFKSTAEFVSHDVPISCRDAPKHLCVLFWGARTSSVSQRRSENGTSSQKAQDWWLSIPLLRRQWNQGFYREIIPS